MMNPQTAEPQVTINDPFWSKLRETVRREGIPYQWKALNDQLPDAEPSYCMRNFADAAHAQSRRHGGCVFQDSDVAKWLEGVAYSLTWHADAELEKTADEAIAKILAAQQPDGYLDTYYIINGLDKRFTNLMDNHELYCAGHMIEAAVAYAGATGKRAFLDAMIRYVDCIDAAIGPGEGKLHGYPGHPVIEMALISLYTVTGDRKHLRLAKYFVDQRGQMPLYFPEECRLNGNVCNWEKSPFGFQYYQAGKPVREQRDAEGHAVRALYLYSGMADVARTTEDETLAAACRALWESVTRRRMYITGGVGSSEYGESFTFDYDLPNDTCYCETCASIALVFFARRMLRMEKKAEYANVMERALYNGIISGMQADGKSFFYVNPLEVLPEACAKDPHKQHVKPERQKWFGCACCPPNLVRLLASLQNYVCEAVQDTLYMHLYMSCDVCLEIGGAQAAFSCRTDYPASGDVALRCEAKAVAEYTLALRVPDWCHAYKITLNGESCACRTETGYVKLRRKWQPGDSVLLHMEMPVTLIRANPAVSEDVGKLAVMRGPVVYCLEEADNGEALHQIRLEGITPDEFTEHPGPLPNGLNALCSPGFRETQDYWKADTLYQPAGALLRKPVTLTWIPYYSWANRGIGEMRVWVRE